MKREAINRMRILHLANDEKFIDQAISSFERAAPGKNDLYVCGKKPLKFIKSPAKTISGIPVLTGSISSELSGYNIVIIHSLNPVWFKVISKLSKDAILVWLGWGYDYYDLIYDSKDKMTLALTRKYIKKVNSGQYDFVKKIKSLIKKILLNPVDKLKVIERINYFSPVLSSEYDIVKNKCSLKKFPENMIWNYGNLEDDLVSGFENSQVSGDSVLVGNSAFAENNHMEAFDLLSKLKINNQKVIAPLSYGDNEYRDFVLGKGVELFGDYFEPLTDFMPINEYVKILKSCGFVVMNHIRQQAVGNIVIMLYLGAKVFLRAESPTYTFFIQQGAVIFSVQDLEKKPELLKVRLDSKSMTINRKVVEKNWSREASDKKTINLLNKVCEPT
ncbi:TDP-N-acetylfucosamine:lipid II N-acetylfucosaminyltransferase [Neptunomonas qingdaonensis]|uniref:4-alpha-L-fucosyltransferase glycosyl transferase group 56 n=1 Tax=Neptunomonas qingdaonensis TaxID=1045558 RepID=A0A1I2VT01_9GAMM|nr:TDP-N-acetylfucosamine:lipid II N-acetylfucosaminyltransferase [Neptunomonas qingdaonensis]SFG92272.1 4-alpha-L-fucosyltransferase glycosyl transferase group 56 [Neptunomonas qingdaonensis]